VLLSTLSGLPHIKDPFDRILIATAIAEELTLLTMDEAVAGYANDRLRVIR
jgi:PIN domain nuclease of toxin-antitoxin system